MTEELSAHCAAHDVVPVHSMTPLQRWTAAFLTREHHALSPSVLLVYLRLCWHDATAMHSTAGAPHIALMTGLSEASIARAFAALTRLGLLRTHRREAGKSAVRQLFVPRPVYDGVIAMTETPFERTSRQTPHSDPTRRQTPHSDPTRRQTPHSDRSRPLTVIGKPGIRTEEISTTTIDPANGGGGGSKFGELRTMMKVRGINPAKLQIWHFQTHRILEFIHWASGADGSDGMGARGNADSVLYVVERRFGPDRPIEGELTVISTGADVPPQPRCFECGEPLASGDTVCPACHEQIVDDLKRLEGE